MEVILTMDYNLITPTPIRDIIVKIGNNYNVVHNIKCSNLIFGENILFETKLTNFFNEDQLDDIRIHRYKEDLICEIYHPGYS